MSPDEAATHVAPEKILRFRALVEQGVRLNRELDNAQRALFQQMMSLLGDATYNRVKDRPDYEAKERKSDLP